MKRRNVIMIIIALIFACAFYVFIFGIKRPFDNEITDGRPFIRYLCQMQSKCHSAVGIYGCSEDQNSRSFHKLSRWRGFKGCNNNTKGYEANGFIRLEYCGCGGLM